VSASDPALWTRAALALAVALGVVRVLLWRRSAASEARGPLWRAALLIALQFGAGALLHQTLFPPSGAASTGTLVVLTGGQAGRAVREPGEVRVALPEAGASAGAERAPDLATALRRWPAAAGVRVQGAGLVPRDQTPLSVPLAFEPPASPRGFVALALPPPAAPGAAFALGGQVGALPAGAVELIDPAGAIVGRLRVTPGQRFVLTAVARTPGLALFVLRLRDAAGRGIEEVAVPVETLDQTPPRVRVLAGAPSPEVKFLRRWAEESGIDLGVEIDVGAGVQLGDRPVPLTPAALSEVDLVVIDDRRWDALGEGRRAALAAAVRDGLGLLLRPTGPLSPDVRRSWAALGLPLSGGEDTRALRLPSAGSEPELGSGETGGAGEMPELARLDLVPEGSQAVSLLRGPDGAALASWRARGRGRIGVWTVTDSYALVLTGRPDRYNDLWSSLFSALARAGGEDRLRVEGFPRAGERVTLCGIIGQARVQGPDEGARILLLDPASGSQACAAYWPEAPGWRLARDGRGRETAFYVHPAGAAPSLAAARNREATLALVSSEPPLRRPSAARRAPGSSYPWFAGLIAVLAALWWLERSARLRGC